MEESEAGSCESKDFVDGSILDILVLAYPETPEDEIIASLEDECGHGSSLSSLPQREYLFFGKVVSCST